MALAGTLLSAFIALTAVLLALRVFSSSRPIMTVPATARRGDVFFVSHGGPPHMYRFGSQAHSAWKAAGKILTETKPKGIVAVSAHWENPHTTPGVIVNTNTSNPLIYDFYGFPEHFYSETFGSAGDKQLGQDVKEALRTAGVQVGEEDRGLDHGIWVPFKVAFDGKTDIPIVQVSLPGDSKVDSAVRLGRALGTLRDKGYAVVTSGQIVHNLRDWRMGVPMPYLESFMAATKQALSSEDPVSAVQTLAKNPQYRSAHPTDEHFLPIPVAVGATDKSDKAQELLSSTEDKLGWGFWRWTQEA
ncbi:Extradiol ring-cleavage dioxygenase, class III enzyme, subunit B [Papiliotrema laurentii]|uniref:Extradiol ring-cleavage dioxygenase, class III enzyme, subunit B n=1 Tax=Papiliotrema laurentii TaxID=5418 RepID=A0AAD9CU15_PAPLA|nr:Extradiol ring-cleavage dioxygenase, class III enzyme, subunit B [Papiliotrema laurentii]